MVLTTKQQIGLELAVERYRQGEKYTCIAGYAGSGKSTLVKFIVAALQVDPMEVGYCAFTGKAATVLKQKGCQNAVTAHKLLYKAKQLPSGKYVYQPNETLDYSIIIVDEVSMLPKDMWDLLVSHDVYILAMGDPFQLPPIDPTTDNHILDNPHVFLDEIMRQALDSEIIRLSMHIREGKPLYTFPCQKEQVQIIKKNDITQGLYFWADQILCATNATRTAINNSMRQAKGFPPEPQIGDKIISLHNHWDTVSLEGSPLTNGVIGEITDFNSYNHYFPYSITNKPVSYLYTTFNTEDEEVMYNIPIDYYALKDGQPQLTPKQEYQIRHSRDYRYGNIPEPPFDFTYGYAITVWKAQGSQWNNTILIEENFPFDKTTHAKYLYTGITRAIKKLVVIKNS